MKMKLEFPSRLLRSARALFGSSSGSAGGSGPEVDDGGRDVEGREGTPRRSARRSARTAAAKVGGLPLPLSGARRSRRVARVGSWGTKKATIVATTKKVQAEEAPVPAPRLKRRKRRQAQPKRALIIELLPDELFDGPVLDALGFKDLCALSLVCRHFEYSVSRVTQRWSSLYRERWGDPGMLGAAAMELAGGWQGLYKAKHLAEKASAPWVEPCDFEVEAMLAHLASLRCSRTLEISVTFLVDGSGSVTQDDFAAMTAFMGRCVESVNRETAGVAKFSVLQFSNEVKTELEPQRMETNAFRDFAGRLQRMNGGTNIAMALARARIDCGGAPHVVLMLTDGRVDAYQATAASEAAADLLESEAQVFAFGVGRSVDFKQLARIAHDGSRVMGLRTLDEPLW